MPDGQYPIADLQLVAVTQGGGGQAMVGLDPQYGKVGLLIGLDVRGPKLFAVGEFHEDFIGPFDDMIVREDDALGIDDNAGTKPDRAGASDGVNPGDWSPKKFSKGESGSGWLPGDVGRRERSAVEWRS